ncbi:MAG: S8 family serine peptidase [Gammaproteobacteria bacterium]|nr:S8 family serine peptidase [Gammaproteobacteria bacterium]
MSRQIAVWRHGVIAFIVVTLSSCGGGGGGSSSASIVPAQYGTLLGNDPLFADQWHLYNQGQFFNTIPGEDINVLPVWNAGSGGQGVTVAVVDDGLEIKHPDLSANVSLTSSYDFKTGGHDPSPTNPSQGHGTAVAGLIGASAGNNIGGRGAAPRVTLAGYNLLWTNPVSTSDMAKAMTLNANSVSVSSNSWGDNSDGSGEVISTPDTLWRDSIQAGVTTGRGGKGTIYVWAAGNGGKNNVDNSNYDNQANDRHVIAVCAVGEQGTKTDYSEKGANLLVCAPGGQSIGLTTTDVTGASGYNNTINLANGNNAVDYADQSYTGAFAGTSAATPLVSGIVALMLEANPNLGWRDVPLILAQSARKNHPTDSDWTVTHNKAGQPQYHINHKYGFGVVDAAAAVNLAKSWVNVGAQVMVIGSASSGLQIPDNDPTGIFSEITIGSDIVVERVEIEFTAANHVSPGDLKIVLTAPSGGQSVLAEQHNCPSLTNICTQRYDHWVFTSVRHMGESSLGKWRLTVADLNATYFTGDFQNWALRIYGRAN